MVNTALEEMVRLSYAKQLLEANSEIASIGNGVFLLTIVAAMGFLYWASSPQTRTLGLVLFLASLVSIGGWFAKCAVLAHQSDEYVQLAESAFQETDPQQKEEKLQAIGGWNTFRHQLKYRTPIMITSYVLTLAVLWVMVICVALPPIPNRVLYTLLSILIIASWLLVILAHKFASTR